MLVVLLPIANLPALSGDVTNSAGNNSISLSNTGVIAGSYGKVTVDNKGRVTTGENLTSTDIPNLDFSKITTGKPTTLAGYGITDGVSLNGDTITGPLLLVGNPTDSYHLVTKQYIDGLSGVGGFAAGDIVRKPFSSTPVGFLKCNGAALDKTIYANLYSAIGDTYTIITTPGSGQPWRKQYQINNTQSGDITGWSTGTSLPDILCYSQAIVTKNRVYLFSGNNNSGWVSTVYTAPINSDGTLGAWSTGTALPNTLAYSQAIVTKNRVYLLGGINTTNYTNTVYTAPINSDGTIGTWTTGLSLPSALGASQAIITKDRVYLLGGWVGGSATNAVYTAPINSDGTLGAWITDNPLPNTLYNSQAIVTKNRVYLLGGTKDGVVSSTVFTAAINTDGTLGTWTTGTSLPTPINLSTTFISKNRVYLFSGFDGTNNISSVYSAPINSDGTLGTWTTGTSLPGNLSISQAIATKNRIYLLGGTVNGAISSTVYTAPLAEGLNDYSPYYAGDTLSYMMPGSGKPWQQQYQLNTAQSTDIINWTTGTALPGNLYLSQAIVTKNRVYLLGGHDGTYRISTVYTAPINTDGTLGTWIASNSLPGILSNSQAIVTKNRVYLLGGNISNGVSTNIVYTAPINSDGTLGTWTTDVSLPLAIHAAQAVVTKNRVYLLSGINNTTYITTIYTAPINTDGTLGSWTTSGNIPGVLTSSQIAVTNNRIYLIGGYNGTTFVSAIYTAPINTDGTLGTWTTDTSLPSVLSHSESIVTKNKVYIFGGAIAGNTGTTTVYTAPINADGTLGPWTTGTALPSNLYLSQAIVTKNRVYLLGGYNGSAPVSTVYTAPLAEGLNDYSPYYDGTIVPIDPIIPITNKFNIPDMTLTDINGVYHYIKF